MENVETILFEIFYRTSWRNVNGMDETTKSQILILVFGVLISARGYLASSLFLHFTYDNSNSLFREIRYFF